MLTINSEAHFSWGYNNNFFLETETGNYIWSDPDYPGGDNIIRPFKGDVKAFCECNHLPYCRDKGIHVIREYCGSNVKIIEEEAS